MAPTRRGRAGFAVRLLTEAERSSQAALRLSVFYGTHEQVATIAASLLLAAGVGGAVGAAVALETRDESPAATPASTAQPVAQRRRRSPPMSVKDGVAEARPPALRAALRGAAS